MLLSSVSVKSGFLANACRLVRYGDFLALHEIWTWLLSFYNVDFIVILYLFTSMLQNNNQFQEKQTISMESGTGSVVYLATPHALSLVSTLLLM